MTRRFEPIEHRRDCRHATAWAVLRARAAFVGYGTGRAVELAEIALGHTLREPRLAIFRASNSRWVKAIAFVWHDGNAQPSLVVKVMPYQLDVCHLRHETEVVALLREHLAGTPLAGTLPLAPLFVDDRAGDYAVVEPVDALGGHQSAADRGRALGWLRELHAATASPRPWESQDDEAILATTRRTWSESSLGGASQLCHHVGAQLGALRGADVPVVAEHRDFWAGNISMAADELRVFDWEWTRLEGRPFFDLWTYDIAEIRGCETNGLAADLRMLRSSLRRVEDELVLRGIDPAFARLTLPSVVGEITFRGDWATGDTFDKRRSVEVMRAAAQIALSD